VGAPTAAPLGDLYNGPWAWQLAQINETTRTVAILDFDRMITSLSFGFRIERRVAWSRPFNAREPLAGSIRQIVAREWESEQRTISRNEGYQKIRSRYTVLIEPKKLASLAAPR
jgi:hypothetical protein